jgi:hypothetical protein
MKPCEVGREHLVVSVAWNNQDPVGYRMLVQLCDLSSDCCFHPSLMSRRGNEVLWK